VFEAPTLTTLHIEYNKYTLCKLHTLHHGIGYPN
jgi:hypothetical protein